MSLWGDLEGIRQRRGRKGSMPERWAGQAPQFCRRAQGRGKRTPGGLRENKNGQCDGKPAEVVIALSSCFDDKPIRHPASIGSAPQPNRRKRPGEGRLFSAATIFIAKRNKEEEIDNVFP